MLSVREVQEDLNWSTLELYVTSMIEEEVWPSGDEEGAIVCLQ
jgi:hypothetical protein